MAIVQSEWARGKKMAPTADCAGDVVSEKFSFTIASDLASGDIIELGVLPAYHDVVDAVLIVDEAGTATYDVGIMSGTFGSVDQSRTCGAEFFSGAADAAPVRMSLATGWRLDRANADRAVGVKVQTAGITAANQVVTLVLTYKG